ncbi:hypothetical protein [Aeromonas media]|uniref:hypothetical protein n=1 Tax=Aeromonas media TaxID=651 RepID=UPI001F00B24E|nr:hypothetical protein [Aeromonas media]
MYRLLLLLLLTLSLSSSPMAATRFTLLSPENEQDARMDYYREAMRLALEKTRQLYGDYELRDSLKMNKARMRLEVQKPGKSALFIVDSWPQKTPHPEVSLIPFPIDLGILGYRVCFVGANRADDLAGVRTLAQLQAFSQGSGKGWQDADILRHNGFQVQEVDNYESLFRMVARGRVDLFCRGANEILAEWETHHPRLPTLTVDPHVALFYPLIHAFYSHATYHKERERIQLGLRLAWQDGSLKRLWRQHFQPSLAFTQLASRQLFRLSNPQLPGEGSDYSSYLYDPARDAFGMPPHDKADRVGK